MRGGVGEKWGKGSNVLYGREVEVILYATIEMEFSRYTTSMNFMAHISDALIVNIEY